MKSLYSASYFFGQRDPGDQNDLRNVAAVAQGITLAKLLAGKQFEVGNNLRQSYFASPLRRKYSPLMRKEAQEAEQKLESHFAGRNIHYRIRNSFAFHYSLNDIAREITRAAKTEELKMVLSDSHGNTLYDMSEVVANRAMLATIDAQDTRNAIEVFSNAVIDVAGWYQTFCDGLIEAILRRYWGDDLRKWAGRDVDVQADVFQDIHIPWFFAKATQ